MIRIVMEMENENQMAWAYDNGRVFSVGLPDPNSELLPGVLWGHAEDVFSPAFWKYQAFIKRNRGDSLNFQIGRTFFEEVSVCLLGGYGMPAELGLAAFERLKELGFLQGGTSSDEFEEVLLEPFFIDGRPRRYRFAKQKSRYLAMALAALSESEVPQDHKQCRDYLTTLQGIGPKTASWIVRNYFASNEVAILDIHIIRAGVSLGLFDQKADPGRKYFHLEALFLDFCRALQEPASLIDAMMWDYMRRIGPTKKHGVVLAA